MANRYFTQFFWTLLKYPVTLYGRATIGASGAVTLVTSNNHSKGILSITKESTAGQYTIVLQDQYVTLNAFSLAVQLASGLNLAVGYAIMSETVNASTKNIVIQLLGQDGAVVNAADGSVLIFSVTLNNSNAA